MINIVLYVTIIAVCKKLLSHWLAYDDLGPQCCYCSYTCDKKIGKMTHVHSARMVFSSRRGHLRTQKASKPLVAGGPHWG